MMPEKLLQNLERVKRRIAEAAARAGREPTGISLMAVTKYVVSDLVRALYGLGLRDFGESTAQGLAARVRELEDLRGACWHLIGHLQRNKVRRVLPLVRSVHSVDSERLLRAILEEADRQKLPPPELYVEVNVSREPQKTGLEPEALCGLLELAKSEGSTRPGMGESREAVAGLMTMAPYSDDPEGSREVFGELRRLRDQYVREGLLPEGAGLSMGMSVDFEVAIEEGATIVRVGSALFEGAEEDR
jgi:pyridoxal phosphate enzyme (YggS family)